MLTNVGFNRKISWWLELMFTMTPARSIIPSWGLLQLSTGEMFIKLFGGTDSIIRSMFSGFVCHWLDTFYCSTLTRWYSRVIFQTPNEELIDGFRICFVAALQKYYEVKKKKTHFICLNVLVVYPVDAPDRPSVHIFFWCRWTTTCLTRLRCTEMVCQKGTWH